MIILHLPLSITFTRHKEWSWTITYNLKLIVRKPQANPIRSVRNENRLRDYTGTTIMKAVVDIMIRSADVTVVVRLTTDHPPPVTPSQTLITPHVKTPRGQGRGKRTPGEWNISEGGRETAICVLKSLVLITI